MELCMAREEVYRLLFMSPLMRKISACCVTRSGRSRALTYAGEVPLASPCLVRSSSKLGGGICEGPAQDC